jgi:hypothetical protein
MHAQICTIHSNASICCAPVVRAPKQVRSRRDRDRPALVSADTHIIGEISGATGFKSSQPALSCKWRLVYDSHKSWAVVRGLQVRKAKGDLSSHCVALFQRVLKTVW